jgi:hypothetical protein
MSRTDTCTLAIDVNGCLQYVVGSVAKILRLRECLVVNSRDEGHALNV